MHRDHPTERLINNRPEGARYGQTSPSLTIVKNCVKRLVCVCVLVLGFPQAGVAQNLLVNGDFEADSVPNYGDNINVTPTGWLRWEENTQTPVLYRELSLVKTDGPGGHTLSIYNSPHGQANTWAFHEADVTHAGASVDAHYIRLNGRGGRWSVLGQRFRAPYTGCVSFGGTVAASSQTVQQFRLARVNESHLNSAIASNSASVNNSTAFNWQSDVTYAYATRNSTDWEQARGHMAVTGGELYAFTYVARVNHLMDDAFTSYVDNANCPSLPAGTPNPPILTGGGGTPSTTITPQDVTLFKSCALEGPHTNNGILGQRWACQVDVTVASSPFSGDIIINDVFTNSSLVNGQILLGQSTSGNGSCFQGDCMIAGGDFDSSGTESFNFDIFVEATGPADVYPLENCVTGEIDDGTGVLQPLTPHCTNGQWIPRSEVAKTCDPLPENASAPYTVNCTIEVTASGLVGGTFVSVMDAFAAQPPSMATVTPTFMNVTSTENWDCIDHALNQPSSIGICELPAEDLMAAGGSSSLDISFQFDVDQAPTQVANCRFTDIHSGSYLAKLSGQRSALRSPIQSSTEQNAGWPQMPDGCVYVDVPGLQLETKVETKITKDCDQPNLTTVNGTLGYLWQCEAEVDVSPSPFAGDVSFTDDGSQISMGSAEFLSVSDPNNCVGLGTDTLDCTYAGATFASPHHVQYDLFTPYFQTNDEISWKNCIEGAAVTPAGSFPSVPMCTGRIIKPADVPVFTPAKEIKLEKTCKDAPFAYTHNGVDGMAWDCKITVNVQPAPFAGSFSFTEDASAITGSTGQIIAIDTPQPSHWACAPNVPTASTVCTIAGANFDPSGSETLGFTLFAPHSGVSAHWKNCVHGLYTQGDDRKPHQIEGNCQEIKWEPPHDPKDAKFEVDKDCKPIGERMVMGASGWFQPWACTLTVTSNGVAFTDPLWINDAMMYGPHNGSQSVLAVTSNDPWQCSPAPYAPGGNQPVCGIQGNQFPHNTSTLTVTLNLFGGSADQFGAQNCAALTLGAAPSSIPADVIDEDCFEFVATHEPKEPQIDLVKTCEGATQSGNGQWTVNCTLTITGQNLPNGHQFRVSDELMSSSTQTATFGTMNAGTSSCGGALIAGGTMAGCDLTTDMINAAGGTLTIPYTGTYQGPGGRPLNGPRAQNCGFVDVPSLGLHGPQGGNGKSCVPVEFKLRIGSGVSDVILDPVTPDVGGIGGTVVTGDPLEATGNVGTIVLPPQAPSITKTCEPLVFDTGQNTSIAHCNIEVVIPAGLDVQIGSLSDVLSAPLSVFNIANVTNPTLTGLPNMGCSVVSSGNGIPLVDCNGPDIAGMSAGGTFNFHWSAEVDRPKVETGTYENCARLTYVPAAMPFNNAVVDCVTLEVSAEKASAPTPAPTPVPTPAPEHNPQLKTRKQQTSDCVANRNTQRYSCGFRITVTNEGNAPFNGPLVVTDTFASPWAQAITQISAGGWVCAQPVGGAVSCENSGLNLPQSSFSYIDLDMQVQGLVNGGTWENCAATGIPNDRKQRVAAIQQVMNARGLAAGPVDGLLGNKTYAALAELQKSLGLPVSRELDDALFDALGLPLAKPGEKACIKVDLPPMPKPPIQCERGTTVQKGESCQCRYDNMMRRNGTACQCKGGYAFVAGKGCVEQIAAPPKPVPAELVCDTRSTRTRGGECVCLDQKNAVKTSSSTCGCKSGLPMVAGKCLSISVTPGKDTHDNPVGTEGGDKCRIRVNGICLK